MLLFLTWYTYCLDLYSTVILAGFEQINAGWAWETIVLDNKFVFSNWDINCPTGWENVLGYIILSLFTQHKVKKG